MYCVVLRAFFDSSCSPHTNKPTSKMVARQQQQQQHTINTCAVRIHIALVRSRFVRRCAAPQMKFKYASARKRRSHAAAKGRPQCARGGTPPLPIPPLPNRSHLCVLCTKLYHPVSYHHGVRIRNTRTNANTFTHSIYISYI